MMFALFTSAGWLILQPSLEGPATLIAYSRPGLHLPHRNRRFIICYVAVFAQNGGLIARNTPVPYLVIRINKDDL